MRQSIIQLSLNVNETVPSCCQCLHEDKATLVSSLVALPDLSFDSFSYPVTPIVSSSGAIV